MKQKKKKTVSLGCVIVSRCHYVFSLSLSPSSLLPLSFQLFEIFTHKFSFTKAIKLE